MAPIRVLHLLDAGHEDALHADAVLLRGYLCGAGIDAAVLTDGRGFAELVRGVRRFRPDIVHTHSAGTTYRAHAAAWLSGVRHLVHTERRPYELAPKGMRWQGTRLLRAMKERVIALFPEQAHDIADIYHVSRTKIATIPPGYECAHAITADQREAARRALAVRGDQSVVLGFAGDPQLSVRSLAELPPHYRSKMVVVIPAPAREMDLRALARDLDVRESVRFVQSSSQFENVLPAADVVAVTAVRECDPAFAIRAMLSGVTVASTLWPGAQTLLGNGLYGFVIQGWEPADIAAELTRIIRQGQARATLANRALAHARTEYDIVRIAAAHADLYRQICGAGTR